VFGFGLIEHGTSPSITSPKNMYNTSGQLMQHMTGIK
jgi:hypothetical protein